MICKECNCKMDYCISEVPFWACDDCGRQEEWEIIGQHQWLTWSRIWNAQNVAKSVLDTDMKSAIVKGGSEMARTKAHQNLEHLCRCCDCNDIINSNNSSTASHAKRNLNVRCGSCYLSWKREERIRKGRLWKHAKAFFLLRFRFENYWLNRIVFVNCLI